MLASRANTPPPSPLSRALVVLLAVGTSLCAATLYYNQPILGPMAASTGVDAKTIGAIPMLTQLGYAAGLFLFAPLGDRLDRRKVIVAKTVALAGALLSVALAPSFLWLAGGSLAIGLCATAAQDLVPAAASLAAPEKRGKVVGSVMTGLLLGILLSRVLSGAISERLGWRAVYFGAATSVLLFGAVAATRLPAFTPTTREPYGALLGSILRLARTLPELRRAAIAQALVSVAFSAFWSTLALALARPPFELGSTVAGMFGIAGAAGAAIAPVAGSLADRRGPEIVIRLAIVLVIASFAAMALCPGSIVVLVAGTLLFDLGTQASLVSHQTIVYGLDPTARSRLNAVLVSSMFLGMASGAFLGSRALARLGFQGVALLAAASASAALVVRLVHASRVGERATDAEARQGGAANRSARDNDGS